MTVIGAIGAPGTTAQNLVDQAKEADQGNATNLPLLIMGMSVMDQVMSLKSVILTPAQVSNRQVR